MLDGEHPGHPVSVSVADHRVRGGDALGVEHGGDVGGVVSQAHVQGAERRTLDAPWLNRQAAIAGIRQRLGQAVEVGRRAGEAGQQHHCLALTKAVVDQGATRAGGHDPLAGSGLCRAVLQDHPQGCKQQHQDDEGEDRATFQDKLGIHHANAWDSIF